MKSSMKEQPIIVKYEDQKVAGYSFNRTTIRSIGVDRDGNRWQFYTDYHRHQNGTRTIGSNYSFVRLRGQAE